MLMNKLQFGLKKKAVDDAKNAIEKAQINALMTGGPILVQCFKNPQIIVEVAAELGFKTEIYEKEDIGFEIILF